MREIKGVHCPVLLKETVERLRIISGGHYVDATVGGGGHAAEIIRHGGEVLGIDLDPQMLKLAKAHLETVCPDGHWRLREGNFSQIEKIAKKEQFLPVNGVIFDLGLSAYHYYQAEKGFSFKDQSLLDMRLSGRGETAAELIERSTEEQLVEIFTKYAQERFAPQIAQALVKRRRKERLTAAGLGEVIKEIYYQKGSRKTKIHPATKVFLSLRIWVNNEFENLIWGMQRAFKILVVGGRLVIISFHSGEDRLVKGYFKKLAKEGRGELLSPKPILPSRSEIKLNRLARSAVLRGIEKKVNKNEN